MQIRHYAGGKFLVDISWWTIFDGKLLVETFWWEIELQIYGGNAIFDIVETPALKKI